MPQDPSTDQRLEELRPNAPVFAVAPVRSRSRVPRAALVGITVGVLAFVAGIAVASSGPTERVARASAGPVGSADTVPSIAAPTPDRATPAPPPTPRASPAPAGSSAFATSFAPAAIIASTADGAACTAGEPREKTVPRTRRDGPRLTFQRSWLIWCPVPDEHRQAFLLDVFESFVRKIPADTYGYSAAGAGAGDALFPYAEYPLAGTVALTADAAGDGFAIAVVLEEWRTDTGS